MNKVVVGHAPSPNLMKVQSRIGSLANNDHKVGQLFIWRKFSQESLVKKVQSRIGSLANADHKVGQLFIGRTKISNDHVDMKEESVRFEMKEKRLHQVLMWKWDQKLELGNWICSIRIPSVQIGDQWNHELGSCAWSQIKRHSRGQSLQLKNIFVQCSWVVLKWFAQCTGKCIASARNRSDIMDSPIQDLILKGRTQNLVHIPYIWPKFWLLNRL